MKRWQAVGFTVLCLLAGSRWLVENAWPSALPPILEQAFHFAVAALVALTLWVASRRPLPAGWWHAPFAGLLLFGLPELLGQWAGSPSGPALYALVPLFVIVGVAALEPRMGTRRLMRPALAGAAGALLVLPFALPTSLRSAAMMVAVLLAVALISAGSIWLHQSMRRAGLTAAVWLVCGVNTILLGVAGLSFERPAFSSGIWTRETTRTLAMDVPVVFLLLWLVREVRPERMAARALIVPTVTIIEGLLLVRSRPDLRIVLGTALMVVGGGALLLSKGGRGEDVPTPLGLLE